VKRREAFGQLFRKLRRTAGFGHSVLCPGSGNRRRATAAVTRYGCRRGYSSRGQASRERTRTGMSLESGSPLIHVEGFFGIRRGQTERCANGNAMNLVRHRSAISSSPVHGETRRGGRTTRAERDRWIGNYRPKALRLWRGSGSGRERVGQCELTGSRRRGTNDEPQERCTGDVAAASLTDLATGL